jgi:hypothetical protein
MLNVSCTVVWKQELTWYPTRLRSPGYSQIQKCHNILLQASAASKRGLGPAVLDKQSVLLCCTVLDLKSAYPVLAWGLTAFVPNRR